MKGRRKKMCTAVVLAGLLVSVAAQGNTAEASVRLNTKAINLPKGASYTLKLTGTNGKVTWKSCNKKVVTVTSKGKIEAKEVGFTKVTATVNKKKYTCKVTVRVPRNSMDVSGIEDRKQEEKPRRNVKICLNPIGNSDRLEKNRKICE